MKHPLLVLALVSSAVLAAPALAQSGHGHGHAATAVKTAGAEVTNTGEVKRINKDTKKVTISHGPLKAFDMPPMTMAFGVKDPALLAQIKPGDKVVFVLEKSGEDLVITRIEAAR